jgi:lipoprotein LpqH
MQNRSIAVTAAALMVIASTAGCVEETKPERAKNARITVSGKTQTTQELSCRQFGWLMIIETKSGPARTRSLLQIGGEHPIAKTVDIQNFDGFSGVGGEGAGNANVSLVNNSYVITGSAEGSDPENPGKTRTVPFRIETPC